MLNLKVHKQFLKDISKVKLNITNAQKLFIYISFLLNEQNLSSEAKDHPLQGEWSDTREFHVGGDLLVIYRIELNTLQLLRIGTHSQIFK